MNVLILISFILSVLLGVGRGVDLALFTDAETGLCAVGSVWLRYAALAVAIGAAVLAGRCSRPRTEGLQGRCVPSGVVALAAAVCFGGAGVLRIFWLHTSILMLVRAVLELLCAAWMLCLGCSWLRQSWRAPAGGLVPAVLGSVVFYWCVLARFMENSSSWHRVAPTAMVWELLAGLVFLSALVRALYLPGTADGRTLCAGALAAFSLCLCWELPAAAVLLAQGGAAALLTPEVLFRLGLCCVGLLGGLCALRCTANEGQEKHSA